MEALASLPLLVREMRWLMLCMATRARGATGVVLLVALGAEFIST